MGKLQWFEFDGPCDVKHAFPVVAVVKGEQRTMMLIEGDVSNDVSKFNATAPDAEPEPTHSPEPDDLPEVLAMAEEIADCGGYCYVSVEDTGSLPRVAELRTNWDAGTGIIRDADGKEHRFLYEASSREDCEAEAVCQGIARKLYEMGYREAHDEKPKPAPTPTPAAAPAPDLNDLLADGKRLRYVRPSGSIGDRVPAEIEVVVSNTPDGDSPYVRGQASRVGEGDVWAVFSGEYSSDRLLAARRMTSLLKDLGYEFVRVVDRTSVSSRILDGTISLEEL